MLIYTVFRYTLF